MLMNTQCDLKLYDLPENGLALLVTIPPFCFIIECRGLSLRVGFSFGNLLEVVQRGVLEDYIPSVIIAGP